MLMKKYLFGEVAKERYLTCKQKQLFQTISIKIQLPLFWDQHSVVPLPVLNDQYLAGNWCASKYEQSQKRQSRHMVTIGHRDQTGVKILGLGSEHK